MPEMKVTVPHTLPTGEAKNRIQKLVGELQKQYAGMLKNVQEKWTGDAAEFSFEMMGFTVSGNFFVEPSQIRLEGKLPMAALPFKGRVEDAIRVKATELLR